MDLVSFVAVGERRNHLRGDQARLFRLRPSSSRFHLLDPVVQTSAGTLLHYYEAKRAERPFWSLSVQVVDETNDVSVI